MKLIAIRHHPRLRRRRRSDPIPCRDRGRLRCRCCRRLWGDVPDCTHADVGVQPQACAGIAYGGVPGVKLGEWDVVLCGDVAALVVGYDFVEAVAVLDHAVLNWGWCGDAVPGGGGGCFARFGGRAWFGDCGAADEAHTQVSVELEGGAVLPDGGILGHELREGDAVNPELRLSPTISSKHFC